jgi:tyrosine-protein phosphatase SIW14
MLSQVDNSVWRGSRPTSADMNEINSKFKTVISLEGSEEDKKEVIELPSVRLISYPISFTEIYITGITLTRLSEIVSQIYAIGVEKLVLVHCEHGEDRTGLIIAAYRVKVTGWTKEAAWNEALKFGYRNWLNFGLNQTWKLFQ